MPASPALDQLSRGSAAAARTPGRWRGTRTRSAFGRMVQRTGVGIMTVSPSMPTGISGTSASTTTSSAVSAVRP